MHTARRELETLLRARKLDGTLLTAKPGCAAGYEPAPTGVASLDERTGGGLPRGQMSEILGPRSSGRTTLALAACAAATARGELVALVDALDRLDPESAARAGTDLSRLLWIRGTAAGAGASGDVARALDRAIKALNIVLQAGSFGLAVLDVADVSPREIQQLPFTTWLRLQRAIEHSRTACVLVGQDRIARSPAGLTIALQAQPAGRWLAARGASRPAFGRRCIPAGGVAPPSHTPGMLGRRAWPAGRIATLGATADLHHGLLEDGARARLFCGLDLDVQVRRGVSSVELRERLRGASAAECRRHDARDPKC